MVDPTYVREEIDANPVWRIAFVLSEKGNDSAPIGWSKYIPMAEILDKIRQMALYAYENNDSSNAFDALRDIVLEIDPDYSS